MTPEDTLGATTKVLSPATQVHFLCKFAGLHNVRNGMWNASNFRKICWLFCEGPLLICRRCTIFKVPTAAKGRVASPWCGGVTRGGETPG